MFSVKNSANIPGGPSQITFARRGVAKKRTKTNKESEG